jgi:hypothetical protein
LNIVGLHHRGLRQVSRTAYRTKLVDVPSATLNQNNIV